MILFLIALFSLFINEIELQQKLNNMLPVYFLLKLIFKIVIEILASFIDKGV